MVSRCTSQINDSIRARDEAVYEASVAGASLGAIGEAAELDVRVVEQIVNEVSRTTAAESS